MQLLSKAYLGVQEWKQMEMETVVGWLHLKEGSEERGGGIKGSKLQVEISTGLASLSPQAPRRSAKHTLPH